jgi:anti-sigma B factor antagonist
VSGTPQSAAASTSSAATGGTPPLTVAIHFIDPGIQVAAVSGDIDMSTSPILLASLLKEIHEGVRYLILDLTAVHFLGAAGLTALVAAKSEAVAFGTRGLCMVAHHRAVLVPLTTTGLDAVLDLQPDLARAYALATEAGDDKVPPHSPLSPGDAVA